MRARVAFILLVVVAGCNGDSNTKADAPTVVDAPPDAPPDAATFDTCAGATELVFANGFATGTANTMGATDNTAASCGGTGGPDVVFKFTTPMVGTLLVNVRPTSGSPRAVISLRSDCANMAAEFGGCAVAATGGGGMLQVVRDMAAGTYYLWLDSADGQAGQFDISLQLTADAGDTCAGPIPLTFTGGEANVAASTIGSTADEFGTCGGSTGLDNVYRFDLTATSNVEIGLTTRTALMTPLVYLQTVCAGGDIGCASAPMAGAGASLRLGSLAAGTHFLWVDAANSTPGLYNLTARISAPGAGDTCANAAPLTFTNGMATVTGNTSTFFHDFTPTCASGTSPDGVYTFTTTGVQNLRVDVTTTSSTYQPVVNLRQASCTGTSLACGIAPVAGGTGSIAYGSLPAGTYYLWVDGANNTSGAFTMTAVLGNPTPGDTCSLAQPLTFTNGMAMVSGDTSTWFHDSNGTCASGLAPDGVYTFTTSTIQDLRLSLSTTTSTYQPAIYVRSASCTGTQLGCGAAIAAGGTATLDIAALPVGTYYVWIDGVGSTSGLFSLMATLTDPLPGDHCTNTTSLTFTAGSASATGTTVGTFDDGAGTCATGTAPDVIYSFTTTTAQNLNVTVSTTTGTYQPAVYLRQASCTGTSLGCATAAVVGGTATLDVSGLPAGTYYLWIDGVGGTAGAYSLNATLTDPPPGDQCTNPLALTFTSGMATATGTTAGTVNDGNGTCATGVAPDVVYTFMTSVVQDFRVTVSTTTGTYQPSIYLRSASCTAGTQLGCANAALQGGSASLDIGALPAGTYYLWIDGVAGTSGAYSINATLTDPLPGDHCTNTTPLTFSGGAATASGTTVGLYNDSNGSCATGTAPDVIYSFTTSSIQELRVTVSTSTGTYQPSVYLRSASCTGTQVGCANAPALGGTASLNIGALPIGTYYLWIDGVGGTSGAYSINATLSNPVAGERCANPDPLVFTSGMAMVTGDTTNMFDDGAGTCGGSGGPDKVYSFTTTQNLQLTASVSTTTGTYRPVIYVRSATCTGTQVTGACNAAATMGGTATLPATVLTAGTYYLWVDSVTTGGAFTLTANLSPLPAAAVRPLPPTDVAVPGPMTVVFEVVDALGGVVTSDSTTRFTVSANGSAIFPTASQGTIVSGTGTNTVLVQVSNGRISLNATDAVAETVTYTATDTEGNGLTYPTGSGTAMQISSQQTLATNPTTNMFNLSFIERPAGNGTLTLTGFGDFSASSEYLDVFMESLTGTSYGPVFASQNQCQTTIVQSVTIPQAALTTYLLDGIATIVTRASTGVNVCTGTLSVQLSFPTTNSARFL